MSLDFDVAGALKAGYTRAQVADYLAKQSEFDLAGARKAGYNDDQIIQHLAPPAPPPPPSRNIAAVANDWVIEAANAIAGTAGAVTEFVSPGNRFARGVEDFVRKGEESQSDVTKQSKQRMRQGLEQADGFGQEAGVIGQYLLESPGLAAAQALGSFAGPGVAIGGASRLAGGIAAGRAAAGGATAAQAAARGAQVGSRVGLGAGAVVSGAAAGGDAAGNAYDLVMAAPDEVLSVTPEWQELAATLPPEQIKERLATAAARDGSVLPAIVGAVTGAFGAEKLIAGTPAAKIIGQATSRRAAALRTGLTEATQEGFEEGVTQYEGQRAASQYDPTIDPMQGVGAATTMGVALGGISGGIIGGVVGPERAAQAPAPAATSPDAQLDQVLNRVEQARNEVFLGTSDGKETIANIVAAPDLGAAIDAAEASVPSMADLLQQKRTTAAERVAQELGIEPAANFPTAEQIIGGAPIPGIDVGPAGDNTRPSVFDQSAGTPGLQPGETRILTQPSVFAEPSAGTPGLQPGETRVLTQPSVFEAPSAEAGQARLATLRAGVDRDAELLARRDGTPAAQPPEQMLRNAQRLEESARLIESNPRAPEAVLQRAQALREQAQSLRARAEEAAASAPAEQAGAMTQFEREQIDAQRQVNQEKRLPSRQDAPAAGYADLAPMDERTARGRLKVLRDQVANEGGDALGLQVVPHPNTEGKFAIARAKVPSLDMPAAPAPAPISQAEANQRLEAAAAKAPTDADAMIEALKVRDTGQAVGAQLLDMLSPGDRLVYSDILRSVEARDGKALPLEAALLDRVNPGAKNYDSLVSAPMGRDLLRTLQGLTESIAALGDPQKQAKDAAGEQLRLNALVRQGERAQGIEQPRAGRAPESLVVENKSPTAGGVERAGQLDRRTGEQRSADAFAALERDKALRQISANLANLFPQQRATEAPDVALIDKVLRKTGALRTADEKMVVDGARKVLTPAQFDILQRGALNPASLGAVERLQLRRMREGDFKFSEQRTDAAPEATQQGKPVSSLGNITTVDPATLPNQSRAQPGAMSRQTHRMVSLLASMFGKKVVVFDSDNDAAPDGFVRRGDSRTIYLNRKSEISHLVVFGHELLHQLKADNPQAYAALVKVIKLEAGVDTNVPGIRGDMEELTADIVGNRFREVEFWQDVFREILASGKDTKVSQRSAMKLGASVVRAVDRMVKALKGMTGFNTDEMVSNLQEVKSAVTKALASYAQEKRGEATELIRQEVAGQQAPAADTTGEVVASDKRGRLDNVEAYRYGKTARTFVNGSSFGAGLKGSSRDMYMNAEDKRLKQRVYFYFDKGTGINPEAGVGPIPHRAFLNNVYDADADPQKLVAGNQLKTESNILDAGFDGYLNRLGGTQSGQVIMFGLKPIPVEALQPGQKVRSGAKLEPLEDKAPGWSPVASNLTREQAEQRVARMRASIGWRGYEIRTTPSGPRLAIEVKEIPEPPVKASDKRGALAGAPANGGGPDPRLVAVAEQYARDNGIDLRRQAEYVSVDEDRARRIAAAYEAMPHAPQDPKVREAYANLMRQTRAQYDALVNAGYEFTFFDSKSDPYQGNPWNAMRDLRANKRMAVYGTYDGYGTEGVTQGAVDDNPMLADTGLRWKDQAGVEHVVTANDLFRAVHDAFGHGLEGAGFRAQGEENAWQAHVRLFTGSAVGAITSETRGQNSWLNYGPYGLQNRNAKVEDTVFADQKTGLMPAWTWTEGRVGDMVDEGAVVASEKRQVNTPEFRRWFGESKVVDGRGRPLVVYHGTASDFSVFDSERSGRNYVYRGGNKGFFFTNRPVPAGVYAEQADGADFSNEDNPRFGRGGANIMPVYLSLQRPYERKATGSPDRWFDYNHNKIIEAAEKAGADGVIIRGGKGFEARNVYIAFRPEQIKSAIGNSGAFDPNDPDIRKSEKRILLNIGLSTKEMRGGGMLTEDVVRSALAKLGLTVDSMPVHPSDTEPTAVPAIDRPLTQEEGDDLSARLNQEAIVQRMPDGSGMLFGPKADEWGPYNPAYFVMADGKYAIEYEIQASAKRKRLDPEVVQTLGRHIRNLLPDEKAKLRRDTAQKMVDIIEGLPQASEMAAVAYAGRAKRGWYYNSAQAIEQVFGGDGPRFAALLAALSPQTSVESNLYNTLATWKNWVQAGRPTDRDTIVSIMGRSVQGSGTEDSVLDSWKNNAVRALTANDPSSVTISGPKVNSFMLNLRGYVDEVTNDAWMANYALVDQKIFSGKLNAAGTDPGKTPGYLAMSARVREAAKVLSRLTGETWTPAEVQETVWSWAKTLYESASVDKSAADIVRNKEITDELIRATPDFRTLFNTDVNERLLRDAGLGDQVERLRAGGDLGGAGQQGAATGGQAAPFAADAQQRYELRAARRLDRLREQRAAGDEVVASEKREVASLFKSLQESRGLGRVRALERVDAHPLGATIRQIDADFLDILDRLDTAGLVKINCK